MSPESFLNFFLNLYIPPWDRLRKGFKFMLLRSLAITFVSQKIQSVHFYLYPKAKLFPRFLSLPPSPPTQKGNFHSSQTAFSGDLFFPQQKGGVGGGGGDWALGEDEDHGVEKVIKINPVRVLVTSSDKSHHL